MGPELIQGLEIAGVIVGSLLGIAAVATIILGLIYWFFIRPDSQATDARLSKMSATEIQNDNKKVMDRLVEQGITEGFQNTKEENQESEEDALHIFSPGHKSAASSSIISDDLNLNEHVGDGENSHNADDDSYENQLILHSLKGGLL